MGGDGHESSQSQQIPGTLTSNSHRNLGEVYILVHLGSCCPINQGGLWNQPYVFRYGYHNLGQDTRDAADVSISYPGGGFGVPPH